MARKKRNWYPGAMYHVMSRGIRRTAVFKDDADNLFFLRTLEAVREHVPFKVHSLCLMTNHFHMTIETEDIHIGTIMKKILSKYGAYFNQRHSCKGHVFEGRYASSIIEDDIYFLEVSRYIHLNPVKAKMVREPSAYEYSSYDLFIHEKQNQRKDKMNLMMSEIVDTSRVLSAFGHNSREQYRMFVEGKLSHAEQEILIQKDIGEDEMWLRIGE